MIHRASGFSGVLVRIEGGGVEIRGRTGQVRVFRLAAGGVLRGRSGRLAGACTGCAGSGRPLAGVTASGSVAVAGAPARVARAGRIWVEGVHDAELVERVWGDDLRVEGVVVERLDGIDHLAAAIRAFPPGPARKLGVLVDHLVEGSKESRIADGAPPSPGAGHRHPLRRRVGGGEALGAGDRAWPAIPMGVDWKAGVCRAPGVR